MFVHEVTRDSGSLITHSLIRCCCKTYISPAEVMIFAFFKSALQWNRVAAKIFKDFWTRLFEVSITGREPFSIIRYTRPSGSIFKQPIPNKTKKLHFTHVAIDDLLPQLTKTAAVYYKDYDILIILVV